MKTGKYDGTIFFSRYSFFPGVSMFMPSCQLKLAVDLFTSTVLHYGFPGGLELTK